MLKLTAATALLFVASVTGFAQEYPAKNVRLVIGFPAGGGADIVGRLVSQKLANVWGRQVLVDNRPGAGTNIANELVAHSPPDGYTLLLWIGPAAPSMFPTLRFDPRKDFAPISLLSLAPSVLVVHPSVPVTNVRGLIDLARAHPGKLNYASTGVGVTVNLWMELFKVLAKVDITHVPYKGAAPAITAITAGEAEVTILASVTVLGLIKTQRMRALAVTSLERAILLPDVPTLNEAGVTGYESYTSYGLHAPAAIARELVEKINAAALKSLSDPDIRKRFADDGARIVGSTPAEFGEFYGKEIAKWDYVVKTSGIRGHIEDAPR